MKTFCFLQASLVPTAVTGERGVKTTTTTKRCFSVSLSWMVKVEESVISDTLPHDCDRGYIHDLHTVKVEDKKKKKIVEIC